MPRDLPIACSLDASALEQRLAAIAEVGAESLVEHVEESGRHVLRFQRDARSRERLEGIVAAEAACCAFLDLSLDDDGDHLILSVAAPEAGQPTADGFARAFAARQ
jgi:pentose-5-phosphate-3-epimerase